MKRTIAAGMAFALAGGAAAQEAPKPKVLKGTLTFFKGNSFDGKDYEIDSPHPTLNLEFDVASIAVYPGEKWQVCGETRYREPCLLIDKDTTDLGSITIMSARQLKQ